MVDCLYFHDKLLNKGAPCSGDDDDDGGGDNYGDGNDGKCIDNGHAMTDDGNDSDTGCDEMYFSKTVFFATAMAECN